MTKLVTPDGREIDLDMEKAVIGGLECLYQPLAQAIVIDPNQFGMIGISMQQGPGQPALPIVVFQNPGPFLNVLSGVLSVNQAFMREFVALQRRVAELESKAAEVSPDADTITDGEPVDAQA